MKKITVKLRYPDDCLIDICVDGKRVAELEDDDIAESIHTLDGEALIVPSRNGELSLRYDEKWGGYQFFDNNHDPDEPFCTSEVEKTIGKGFRKKPFTFYLREI